MQRRDFLRVLSVVAGGGVLAACGAPASITQPLYSVASSVSGSGSIQIPDPVLSTIAPAYANVPRQTSTPIVVTIKDTLGQPIAGASVSLSKVGVVSSINPPSGLTNSNGVFLTSLMTGKKRGTITVTATCTVPSHVVELQQKSIINVTP